MFLLPWWLRQCLCPYVSTALVAKTPPLPCVSTALVAKKPPSPCVSTVLVAETVPLPVCFHCLGGEDTAFAVCFHCLGGEDSDFGLVFPLSSWLRQCLCPYVATAFVANTLPFLAGCPADARPTARDICRSPLVLAALPEQERDTRLGLYPATSPKRMKSPFMGALRQPVDNGMQQHLKERQAFLFCNSAFLSCPMLPSLNTN